MKKTKIFYLLTAACFLTCSCLSNRNNGIVEDDYPDGTIKSAISMKNGLRKGLAKYYDEKGRLLSTAEYVNDLHEGWVINYDPKNGKIASKAFYKNDLQDGPVILYYQGGKLFRESNYVKGRVDGLIKTYWPDGKIKAEHIYKMGKPAIGLKEYDKNGKLLNNFPTIIINRVSAERNTYKIFLSDKTKDVDFYLEELEDGKYFDSKTHRLRMDNGVAKVYNPKFVNNKLSVVARLKTEDGSTLILHRYYNGSNSD